MEVYIFDLDGALLDSMGVWQDVDIEFLEQRGFTVPGYKERKEHRDDSVWCF